MDSVTHQRQDLIIVFVLGIISFFMRLYGFPIASTILGIVLGPLIEQEFRSLAISVGDPSIFVTSPISAGILLIAAVLFLVPVLTRKNAAHRRLLRRRWTVQRVQVSNMHVFG